MSQRQVTLLEVMEKHPKAIIFYNFDYELELLKNILTEYEVAEWNGHKHNQFQQVINGLILFNTMLEQKDGTASQQIQLYSSRKIILTK